MNIIHIISLSFFYTSIIRSTININSGIENVVKSNNEFGLKIYKKLSSKNKESNIVISPYSIFSVFGMVLAGAKGNTYDEIEGGLGLCDCSEEMEVHISNKEIQEVMEDTKCVDIAQGMFLREGATIHENFRNILVNYYSSDAYNVLFEEPGRTFINDWVYEKTRGLIENLIPKGVLNTYTFSVLVNTIYFKNSWFKPFDPVDTKSSQFVQLSENEYKISDNPYAVDMMEQKEIGLSIGSHSYIGKKFTSCSMLYRNDNETKINFRMIFVLPDINEESYFYEVERLIVSNSRNFIQNVIKEQEYKESVDIRIPKFEIEFMSGLSNELIQMGMVDAFDANKADFSGISNVSSLHITDVIHKAKMILDEEGTEAAAATAVIMGTTSIQIPEKTFQFSLHRPFFYFLIHEETNLILFNGKIMKPDKSDKPIEQYIRDYQANKLAITSITLSIGIPLLSVACICFLLVCLGLIIIKKSRSSYKKMNDITTEINDERIVKLEDNNNNLEEKENKDVDEENNEEETLPDSYFNEKIDSSSKINYY